MRDGVYLDPHRAAQLEAALSRTIMHPVVPESSISSSRFDSPPKHIFQILDHLGAVLVSFPPSKTSNYDPEDYASLTREVLSRPKGSDADTTSCTRRFRQKHPM